MTPLEFTLTCRRILQSNSLADTDPSWQPWSASFERRTDDFCGLRHEVEVGGAQGGSCWGDSARDYTTDEVPAFPFEALDALIEELAPALSWRGYRRVMAAIRPSRRSVSEYYGNGTDYAALSLAYSDLQAVLDAEATSD